MQYDAVLFDFDGVLVENPSRGRLYAALERTYAKLGHAGPVAETVPEVLRGDFDSIASRCRTLGIDADDFCSRVGRELVRTQIAAVERGLRSAYDDVVAIASLERPLGIVSDNHPRVVSTVVDRLGLDSLFEVRYGCPLTPDGLDRRKPDPRNIEDAMDSLEAASALYVGDRNVDVRAAQNAGIDSALLSREEGGESSDANEAASETESVPDPTYRITSLSQVPSILE